MTFHGDLEGAAGLLLGNRVAGVEGDLVVAHLEVGLEPRAPGRLRPHVPEPVQVRGWLLVRDEGLVPARRQLGHHVLGTVQARLAVP